MTNRERIINTVLCKKTDRLPFMHMFGPWPETIERWESEGLEDGQKWKQGFGFDAGLIEVAVNYGYSLAYEYQILEDRGDTLIARDTFGIIAESLKVGSSIPRYIEYPIKDHDDWEKMKKERLDPDDVRRFPDNWNELIRFYNEGDAAVQLGVFPYGLFGTLRDMMGVEELLVSFYQQPDLIHEMMDYLTDFWIKIYEKVCKDVKVDCIHMWEDMSGKGGSLISPKMVRDFMMPNYKKLKKFAVDHDIPIFSLDTDGDCSELVPLYIESGINLIYPFEVAAGCNIVKYKEQYPNLCILGGIDKREIAKGRENIDKEFDRISSMFDGTGYIPWLDHLIHPQISWDDFNYFVSRLKERIGI